MAKQVVKSKKSSAKPAAKTAKPAVKSAPKPAAKKKVAAKPAAKPVAKKPVAKPVTKKVAAKPVAKKPVAKSAAKPVAKPVAKAAVKVQAAKPAAKKPVVKAPVKKPVRLSPVAVAPAPVVEWTEDKLKTVKTGLNKKELEQFRQSLLEHRAEIVGDMQGMEDARNVSAGDLSHMPLHMADVGSDNYDQEFTIGILESERKILNEIDAALTRMEKGYYGVCIETGQAIERPRLEAMPWAKYGKEAALRREKQIG